MMSEPVHAGGNRRLPLTIRQRRLRVITGVVLVVVVSMIAIGATQPFFRQAASPAVAASVREEIIEQHAPGVVHKPPSPLRRAVFAHLLLIYLYWIVCILLTTSLFALAWLDMREVRRQAILAQREMWREAADKTRRVDGK